MLKVVEAVTAGHPDKICDQIADALLDAFLQRDPQTRGSIEVFGSHGMLAVGGTVKTRADFDCARVAQSVYEEIVQHNDVQPFVNIGIEEPAGDEVLSGTAIVHGYATRETREFLPRPYVVSQSVVRQLDQLRQKDPAFYWLRPHGKVQLVSEGKEITSLTLLLATDGTKSDPDVQQLALARVIEPALGSLEGIRVQVNPYSAFSGGEFVTGSGSTGRKLAHDTYGGLVPHGISAVSGKSPWSADRAGLYMARFVAKSLVNSGVAPNAFVSAAYTHGREEPMMVQARAGDGTDLSELVRAFDFRPSAIVERFGLTQVSFRDTASYGHFSHGAFPWEHAIEISA